MVPGAHLPVLGHAHPLNSSVNVYPVGGAGVVVEVLPHLVAGLSFLSLWLCYIALWRQVRACGLSPQPSFQNPFGEQNPIWEPEVLFQMLLSTSPSTQSHLASETAPQPLRVSEAQVFSAPGSQDSDISFFGRNS